MPDIRVIYWNVESFGADQNGRRGNSNPLCSFIARVLKNVDADVLCLVELRQEAIGFGGPLDLLQIALNNAFTVPGVGAGGYTCDWYCDWVPGALVYDASGPPYNPNTVSFTSGGRNEGYAVFWKQNIAKFTMQPADPIDLANATPSNFPPAFGTVANTQSGGVQARGVLGVGATGADITTGLAPQYFLPIGSTAGAGGIMRGLVTLVAAHAVTGIGIMLLPGDVLSAGTQIAGPGVTLTNNPVLGRSPIVIPGLHTLTAAFTMPGGATLLAPQHALSLVMTARRLYWGAPANYNPAGPNFWELASFPVTKGAALWNGSRRPAFCTIKTTTAPAGVQQLLPLTMYHTPVSDPKQAMLRCSYARSLYEARMPGGYAHNTRALVGGDLNAKLVPTALHYATYTNPYGGGGADFNDAGNPNIRVNSPAPMAPPVFPPWGPPATVAQTPENRSILQLRYPPKTANHPILSTDPDYYRGTAIDNIFYRGFTAAQAPRFEFRATLPAGAQQQFEADLYDLVRAVMQTLPPGAVAVPGGAPAAPDNFFIPPALLMPFANVPVWAAFAPALAGSLAPLALWGDLAIGQFPNWMSPPSGAGPYVPVGWPAVITPQRRAAEFIKLFVSDHLPVLFRMNI